MSEHVAVGKLKEKFPGSILDVVEFRGDTSVAVKKEDIVPVGRFLKEELGFNLLCDVCGVDFLGESPRFLVVYNLFNVASKQYLRIKVPVEEGDARVDTVSGVWGTANWHERECWDLMGIEFRNHPDLRRILMPDEYEGHPLRKDFPVQGPDREPYQGRVS